MKNERYMKRLLCYISVLLFIVEATYAQGVIRQAPAGFDTLHANIPHGTIDTITYESKTVGVKRRAIIYTPPGFSKKNIVLYY